MSEDLAKTIERLEQWVEHWSPHYPPEFIAELKTLIGVAKAAMRVVEVLQAAQRYHPVEYSRMERRAWGGWVDSDDVDRAIRILQEGQNGASDHLQEKSGKDA